MPGCCAVGCTNRRDKGYKLFRLPSGKNDVQRRNMWLLNIKRKDFKATSHTVLCEVHFEADQFEENDPGKLKPTAVPTLFAHMLVPKRRQVNKWSQRTSSPENNIAVSLGNIENTPIPVSVKETINMTKEQNIASIEDVKNTPIIVSVKGPVNMTEEQNIASIEDLENIPIPVPVNETINRTKKQNTASIGDEKNTPIIVSVKGPVNMTEEQNIASIEDVENIPIPVPVKEAINRTKEQNTASIGDEKNTPIIVSVKGPVNMTEEQNIASIEDVENIPIPVPVKEAINRTEEQNIASVGDVKILKRYIKDLQRKLRKATKEKETLKKSLSNLFNEDQLKYLEQNTVQPGTWSEETIEKALQLHFTCGIKGYSLLLDQGFPLPSARTLRRRIQNILLITDDNDLES